MAAAAPFNAGGVNDLQLEAIRQQLSDIADRMTDEQILRLADSLHDQLRARKVVRAHAAERLERRMGGDQQAHPGH